MAQVVIEGLDNKLAEVVAKGLAHQFKKKFPGQNFTVRADLDMKV
jgi:hypothetical protein